jgi:hypothetical protein
VFHSWNDGKAKQSIVDFVQKVARKGSPDFVPVAERIATFDNDGTLWAEQPMYFQAFFIFDRIQAMAPIDVPRSQLERQDTPASATAGGIGGGSLRTGYNSFVVMFMTLCPKNPGKALALDSDRGADHFAGDDQFNAAVLLPSRGRVIGSHGDRKPFARRCD